MATIERHHSNHRMSQIVTHGDMIYLAGQVAAPGAEVGSDKEQILQAIIWLADMSDFAEMNAVWDAWVPQGHTPARACGGAPLATPEYKVEIIVTAVRR